MPPTLPVLPPRLKRMSELPAVSEIDPADKFALVQQDETGDPVTRRATVEQFIAKVGALGGSPVTSVAGQVGTVTLVPASINGLGPYVDFRIETYDLTHPNDPNAVLDGGNF